MPARVIAHRSQLVLVEYQQETALRRQQKESLPQGMDPVPAFLSRFAVLLKPERCPRTNAGRDGLLEEIKYRLYRLQVEELQYLGCWVVHWRPFRREARVYTRGQLRGTPVLAGLRAASSSCWRDAMDGRRILASL